jgi:hypothetical protein
MDQERSGHPSLSNTFSNHIDEMVWADRQVMLQQSQLALISHTAMLGTFSMKSKSYRYWNCCLSIRRLTELTPHWPTSDIMKMKAISMFYHLSLLAMRYGWTSKSVSPELALRAECLLLLPGLRKSHFICLTTPMTTWKNRGLVFNHKHMLYLSPLTSIYLKGWGGGDSNLVSDFPLYFCRCPWSKSWNYELLCFHIKWYFQSYFNLIKTCIPKINCRRSNQNLVLKNVVFPCQSITSIQFRVTSTDKVTTINWSCKSSHKFNDQDLCSSRILHILDR